MRRRIAVFAAAALALALFAGCASNNAAPGGRSANAPAATPAPTEAATSMPDASGISPEAPSDSQNAPPDTGGRKVIFSATLSIQTKDFTNSMDMLNRLITGSGAYIESSNITGTLDMQNRSAALTIRVPVAQYNAFKNSAGGIGTVVAQSENNTDITDQYYDTQAHLDALNAQHERLLALMNTAASLADLLKLQDQLTDVEYQIDTLSGALHKYDSLVSFSTVTVNLYEVQVISPAPPEAPKGFWTKFGDNFLAGARGVLSFFKGVALVISAAFPTLATMAVIAGIIIFILYKTNKIGKKRKTPPKE